MEHKDMSLELDDPYQRPDFTDETSTSAEKIPIPSQMPELLKLDQIPVNILRSGTVDALIAQSEDLMSRLSVSLKRNSLLEERLLRQERLSKALQHRNDVLKDQILILEEKDKVLLERTHKVDQKIEEYRNQIQLLEVQYSELYTDSQEQQRSNAEALENLRRRLGRYLKYRANMKQIARQNRDAYEILQSQATRFQSINEQLKVNVTDLATRVQTLGREKEEEQQRLVNSYEDQMAVLKQQVLEQEKLQLLLHEKTEQVEKLHERNVELENRFIAESRRLMEMKARLETDLSALQKQNAELRIENKTRILETEDLSRVKEALTKELKEAKVEHGKINDQIESLQCLWRDSQSQVTRQNEKNEALQKLNQQLSTTLNQYRREILNLKQRLEFRESETREKLKELQGQLQVIAAMAVKPQDPEAGGPSADERTTILERIDELMAQIQSGFDKIEKE